MRLIKNRSEFLTLSRTGNKSRVGFFLSIFFLFIVTLGYIREIINHGKLTPFQIVAGILILFVVLSIINIDKSNKIKIKNPLVYNPEKKGDKRAINLFLGFSFMLIFSVLLMIVGVSAAIIPGLVGLALLIITIYGSILEVKRIYIIYEQARKIGTSKIKILNKEELFLGDTLKIKFENPLLHQNLSKVEVFLRNVHEKWESKDEKDSASRNTYFLHEERQVHEVDDSTLTFEFMIPPAGVKGTDYVKHAPYYWELEVSNQEHKFFTRFFIEVKQLELVESK